MTPIRATWSSFFGSRNSRFKSQFRTKKFPPSPLIWTKSKKQQFFLVRPCLTSNKINQKLTDRSNLLGRLIHGSLTILRLQPAKISGDFKGNEEKLLFIITSLGRVVFLCLPDHLFTCAQSHQSSQILHYDYNIGESS